MSACDLEEGEVLPRLAFAHKIYFLRVRSRQPVGRAAERAPPPPPCPSPLFLLVTTHLPPRHDTSRMSASRRGSLALADTHSPRQSFSPWAVGSTNTSPNPRPRPSGRQERVRVASCHRLQPVNGHNLADGGGGGGGSGEHVGSVTVRSMQSRVTKLTEPVGCFMSTVSPQGQSVCQLLNTGLKLP